MTTYNTEPASTSIMLKRSCRVCGAEPTDEMKLLRCSQCKVAFFCSAEHQKANWSKHKPKCKKHQAENTHRDIARSLELDATFLTQAHKELTEAENKEIAETIMRYREGSIPFAQLCDYLIKLLVPKKRWRLLGDVQYLASESLETAMKFYDMVETSRLAYKEARSMPLFPNVVALVWCLKKNKDAAPDLLFRIMLSLNNQIVKDENDDLDPITDILAHGGYEIIQEVYDRGYKEDAQLESAGFQVLEFINARRPAQPKTKDPVATASAAAAGTVGVSNLSLAETAPAPGNSQ